MWGQFYLSLLQTYSALHLLTQYILFLIHVLTFERFSIDLWRSCSFGVLVYALVRNRCRHLQQYSPYLAIPYSVQPQSRASLDRVVQQAKCDELIFVSLPLWL